MNQINQDIKSNYEIWKTKIVNELYGDQYKSRMEKRIIDNDELQDNKDIKSGNQPAAEQALFLKIRSTFDKSIMLYLGESVTWKRFAEFPLPNEAAIL